MPHITDEQMVAFQQLMQRMTPQKRREGPDPAHRGVVDPDYVRPAPTEYPRMMHHATGMTKIVQSRQEQEALGEQWHTTPQIRPTDWRSKLNEVFTASGFRVYPHHVDFLTQNGVAGVTTLREAASFIDNLTQAEQEQFFEQAETAAYETKPEEVKVGRKK